ncbi:MAG: DUF4335 domain-containing protein [Chlorogloeopsis fritschii C42_A2020_084]|uniref:DUF4335 domain-containing protein n=1 Tax=Chlorogloeopsis fritschii TaxID=1124 RepID=UPI0019F3DD15|nr:DUF4335 domain-containing protein [Chlorogloeopsis fritschii]MBF2009632.1 DUF4335 domain-containing protein [Chlorogloeopsis fritschii C42_A2020_084]
MPLTNSVIRRYTPPTCTLEVLAQSSPLSRWVGKSVLKQLRFELRFDDPRLPEEQRIVIRGDREQLEALCAAVTNYVQEFLKMPPEKFWATFSGFDDSSKVSDNPQLQEPFQSSQAIQTLDTFNTQIPGTQIPGTEIYIKPSSHLTHNLFLGSLGYQVSTPVIQLSLLQLFDLATALDEYSADVLALPVLYQRKSSFPVPAWASVAAVLVLGVGLVPLALQYTSNKKEPQTAKQPSAAEENIALEPSPLLNPPNPTPALTPADQLPSLSFGSGLSIPGSTLPTNPQTLPPSQSALPPISSNLPSTPSSSPQNTFPSTSQSPSGSVFNVPQTTAQNLPNSQAKNTPQTLTKPEAAIQADSLKSQQGTVSTPTGQRLPSTLPATPGNPSSGGIQVPPNVASMPNIPTGSANTQTSSPTTPTNSSVSTNDSSKLVNRLRANRNPRTTVATGTLFDTAQVAEAREFLRKRWQPPGSLKQALEYSLIVGVDGTIERIFPLGKAAREYVDRTGMPLIGEPFVSPSRSGQAMRIRAVLNPDGKVQTFPEPE